jgi:inner membrane protein
VEPVTHALTSLALARAGQRRLPRHGTAIILVAGVAPDLDYASYLSGASAFLRLHRALLHSIPGAAFVACATAGIF